METGISEHPYNYKKEVLFQILIWMTLINLILNDRGETQKIQRKSVYLHDIPGHVKLFMGLEVSLLVTFDLQGIVIGKTMLEKASDLVSFVALSSGYLSVSILF